MGKSRLRLISAIDDSKTERIFPGVRGRLRKTLKVSHLNNTVELPKNTRLIIRPLNRHKADELAQFELTCFVDNKGKGKAAFEEDRQESGTDITLGQSYRLTLSKGQKPRDLFIFDEYYQLTNSPLFAEEDSPKISEITQGRVADCFFLASIQAILNHPDGKAFIRGMMRENPDGTITVRLFHPITLEPHYFNLSSASLQDKLGSTSLHKSLWVHALESAYTALGKSMVETPIPVSSASVFSGGGKPTFALKILTGLPSKNITVAGGNHRHPTAQFSGRYTRSQLKQFRELKNALEQQQLVIAGTHKKFPVPVPGLLDGHSYTVLGVNERLVETSDSFGNTSSRKVLFLTLRNPWGRLGRSYKQNSEGHYIAAEDPKADTFELELIDFNKYFLCYCISDPASERFSFDHYKELLSTEVSSAVTDLRIDADSSFEELLEFEQQYKICTSKLIQLEYRHIEPYQELKEMMDSIFASADMEEEVKKRMISGLIADIDPDFYTGSKENIYNLLYLRWLQENQGDSVLQEELIHKIIASSGYEAYQVLSAKKIIAEAVATAHAKATLEQLSRFNLEYKALIRDIRSPEFRPDFVHVQHLALSLTALEKLGLEITLKNAALRNLGYSISSEEMVNLAHKMEKIVIAKSQFEALNDPLNEITIVCDLVMQNTANLEELGLFSYEQKEQLVKVLDSLDADPKIGEQLNQLGKIYSESDQREQQDLGQNLTTLSYLIQRVCLIFQNVKQVFDTAFRGFFFKKDYEEPARDIEKKDDIIPKGIS